MNTPLRAEIKDAISMIVCCICEYAEDVLIKATGEPGVLRLEIVTNAADKKRVIGKKGVTINAIRTVCHSSAARQQIKTFVNVLDD